MTMLQNLHPRPHSPENDLDEHDLACLADWAHERSRMVGHPDWKRAYSLIREGSDLLLRRSARMKEAGYQPTPEIQKEEGLA